MFCDYVHAILRGNNFRANSLSLSNTTIETVLLYHEAITLTLCLVLKASIYCIQMFCNYLICILAWEEFSSKRPQPISNTTFETKLLHREAIPY